MGPNNRTKAAALGVGLLFVAGTGIAPAQAADYPVTSPISCTAKAVSNGSKIKVTVSPALAGKQWYTFRLDKKTTRGWTRYLKLYTTQGGAETRTVNVRKGTWRAKCYGEHFPLAAPALDATSNRVKIKR